MGNTCLVNALFKSLLPDAAAFEFSPIGYVFKVVAEKIRLELPVVDISRATSVSSTVGTGPTSIAFDSAGNSYVGNGGGNGLIGKYALEGSFAKTPTRVVSRK